MEPNASTVRSLEGLGRSDTDPRDRPMKSFFAMAKGEGGARQALGRNRGLCNGETHKQSGFGLCSFFQVFRVGLDGTI